MSLLKEEAYDCTIFGDNRKCSYEEFLGKPLLPNLGGSLERYCFSIFSSNLKPTVPENSNLVALEADSFAGMNKLKLLQLNHVHISGPYKKFPKGLRWLCWRGFPLKSIPGDFPLESLVGLDMQYSRLKNVWEGTKNIRFLKVLNLSHSYSLAKTPDVSELPNLERLVLKSCTSLIEVHESIGSLERLVLLNLEDCKSLRNLPRSICMLKHLETLVISGCSNLDGLPTNMENMESLTVLRADGIAFYQSVPTIGWVNAVQSFIWPWRLKPRESPEISWPSLPRSLVELRLANCNLSEDDFPGSLSNLCSLKKLDLSYNQIRSLPDFVRGLTKLDWLGMHNCPRLRKLYDVPQLELYCYDNRLLEEVTFQMSHRPTITCQLDACNHPETLSIFKLESIGNIEAEIVNNLGMSNLQSMENLTVKLTSSSGMRQRRIPPQLTGSCLLKFVDGLLLSCGDERIIVFTTNNRDLHDAALRRPFNKDIYIHKSSPQPVALPAEGEIVQLNSFEQKPLVDFDATNSRTHQSSVFVSNPEKKNTREISKRQSMTESVRSLIDSTTRSSSMDFDAPDNKAHLLRAHQSNPIVFNSENKYTIEGLRGECLTKNVPSLDDSRKQESLLDFDATENKAHLFRAYQIDPVVSLSENKNRGEALKSNIKSVLGLEDLQQHCGDRHDDAAKTSGAIYELGFHTPDSLAWKSFEVLETLPTEEQPIDCVPLLAQGRLPLEGCVQQEKSPDLPRVMQINGVEQRVTKMPRYLGGLTAQSESSSRWHISLPVLLDPLDQSTKNIEHVARADQCSPTVFLAEKKMVRKCRTMSVIFEENHLHFGRKCECAAKSLGAMRICRKHGINQKWATRKGYSLGEENPFEVRRLSMDEKLDSRLQLIHMSQFARSSPRALALSDGGIVRPTALSSSEFAATNNRADLVSQDQSSSAASHYRCKNTRETSDKQGLEDLQQHFGCKHKYALKSLGVSGSMFKSTCRQHWFYWWQGRLKNNEQQAFDATSNRAHLVKVDERGPTVSNALFLDDLRHQFGARCKDAAKGLHAKCIRRQLVIHRLSTAKHTHKQHGIHQWPFQQSAIGLPDGGHILSLSEKKIVSKTLKRKCRSMSVLSLVDCQQHVDRRWEDATKNIGAKRICRQLVIHRVSIAKRICRQHGIHHRWPFERDWATMKGYSLGDERPVEVIRLYTDGKLVSRRRCIYISWLGRFSPWRSALPGGLIVGPIALSSSEFAGTNNIAQRVGQDQRGSGSENERTREQEDPREINTNINSNDLRRHSGRITSDDLRRLLGRMNRAEAANYFGVSVATFKRECRKHGIEKWPLKNGAERKKKRRKKDEWRLPDQHGGNNPSSTCRTMATNGLTEIQNVMVGQDLNEFFLTYVDGPAEEMPIDSGSLDDFRNWLSSLDAPPQGSDQPQIMSRLPENDQSTPQCGLPIVVSNEGVASNPDGGPVNPVERERTPEAHNDPIVPASGSHLVASTRSVNIADTTNQSFSQTDSDLARLAAEIEAVSESLKSQTGSPESSLPSSFLQYGEEVQAQVDLFFDLLKLPFEELVMNKSKELTDCMSILVQKRVFPLKEHIVLEIFFNNSSDTFSLFKYHNEEMRQKKELLNSFSSISTKVSNMQSEVLSVKSQLSALDQEENSLLLRLEQILAEKNALLQKKDGCSREFEKLKEEVKGVSAQTTAARADLLRNDIKRTEMIKRWENLLTFFANPTS